MTRPALNRRSALQLGSVVLLLGVQHIARGATIVAVRVWPSKDYTRLTIESDGEIKARQFFVAEPPRLAVDIEGIDLIPALRELVAKGQPDAPPDRAAAGQAGREQTARAGRRGKGQGQNSGAGGQPRRRQGPIRGATHREEQDRPPRHRRTGPGPRRRRPRRRRPRRHARERRGAANRTPPAR